MMEKDFQLLLRYDGEINAEVSRGITLAVHNQMNGIESDLLTRKRVTHIITECLLNLTHHAESTPRYGKYVHLCIESHVRCYEIKTRNYVSNKKINFLTDRLDRINGMNSNELYEHYLNQLQTGHYTNKGTAGLGFLDMARKSGNKLKYEFIPAEQSISHFDFGIIVVKPSAI